MFINMFFFTKLEESSPVPAGFLTAQFPQKIKIMKPLFLLRKLVGSSLYCLPGGKGKYCNDRRMMNGLVLPFLFPH